MLKKMVASAVLAGFAAGLFAALLQWIFIEPVLLEAELYETGAKVHFAAPPSGHHHDRAAMVADPAVVAEAEPKAMPATGPDLQRHGLTVIFMALVYVGYALLLVAGFALAEMQGQRVTVRSGLIWGLAGFIAIQFAPAIGLAPELPGMAAADLTGRQIWWGGTVVSTATALWLIGFGRNWAAWGGAIALLFLPHLIGAPEVMEMTGPTPPELSAEFAGRALGTGMAGWVVLGLLAAAFWRREAA